MSALIRFCPDCGTEFGYFQGRVRLAMTFCPKCNELVTLVDARSNEPSVIVCDAA